MKSSAFPFPFGNCGWLLLRQKPFLAKAFGSLLAVILVEAWCFFSGQCSSLFFSSVASRFIKRDFNRLCLTCIKLKRIQKNYFVSPYVLHIYKMYMQQIPKMLGWKHYHCVTSPSLLTTLRNSFGEWIHHLSQLWKENWRIAILQLGNRTRPLLLYFAPHTHFQWETALDCRKASSHAITSHA